MVLKRYSDNQASISKDTKVAQKQFQSLLRDIDQKKLSCGMMENVVYQKYGNPVAVLEGYFMQDAVKRAVYRNPFDFFNGHKVYLYFDCSKKLVYWQDIGSQVTDE